MSSRREGLRLCAMNGRVTSPRRHPGPSASVRRTPAGPDGMSLLEETFDRLTGRGCLSVLDVGCGDGHAVLRRVEHGPAGTLPDPSAIVLRRAAMRLGTRALLLQGNLAALGMFGASSLDAITCFGAVGLVDDVEGMLAEFQRVLRPEGVLVLTALTTADRDYGRGVEIARHTFCYQRTFCRFYERDELRRLLANWRVESLERRSWTEPVRDALHPHHTSRRDGWVVIASNPFGD